MSPFRDRVPARHPRFPLRMKKQDWFGGLTGNLSDCKGERQTSARDRFDCSMGLYNHPRPEAKDGARFQPVIPPIIVFLIVIDGDFAVTHDFKLVSLHDKCRLFIDADAK